MTNEEEQEVVRSVFRAYINDLKAHSTKTDRPTFKMLEEVKDKVIKALEQQPCEDCISRQAVLDMATTIQTDDFSGNEIIEVVDIDDIKELPSVTPQPKAEQKWIPCTDRLPEPNRLVLCYITTGASATYFLALWNDTQNAWEEGIGGCRLLENDLGYEVIAWMPLPESYKKNNEFSM